MRQTDPDHITRSYFRSQDRLFALNGQWFFTTREGEIGPFRSRETAIREVKRYVQERHDLERFQKARDQGSLGDSLSLSIVPKDDEPDLSLDDLILAEIQR